MRVLIGVLASCALVAACAPSGATPDPVPAVSGSTTTTISEAGTGLGANLVTTNTTHVDVAQAAAPLDKVWTVLPAAYMALGLKAQNVDPASHTLGVSNLRIHGKIGDTRLSKYLDCGNTVGGMPSADTYEIRLTVLTHAQATAAGTQLTTTVSALGRPITLSDEWSQCTTTGGFEQRLVDELNKQLLR